MSELELWNELGNIYYTTGDYNKAIHTCHKVIELDPKSGVAYSNLASIFICQGQLNEAIPMFYKAIDLLGEKFNKASLWRQLGDTYRKLEDYKNASTSYRRAIDLEPGDEAIRKNLAEVELASRKGNAEAIPATGQDERPSSLQGSREKDYPTLEEPDAGVSGTASWIFKENKPAQQPEQAGARVIMPVILGNRILADANVDVKVPGQTDSAKGGMEESAQDMEKAGHAILRLGILHWRKGEFEKALQFLRDALHESQKSQDLFLEALCHYVTAQVETDLGMIEEAIQSYQSAANLAPERIFPWNNMGNLNCMIGHYEDARAAFQEAIEHDPKDPVSWNGLGDVYHKLGRFEDAIAAYQLGNVFERTGLEEDVLKELEKTMDFDERNPQVWNEAGDIYYHIGAYQDAIESYRKAIELEPANAAFQASLAKAELALEEINAGEKTPTQPDIAEILQDTLPQSESRLQEATPQQAELRELHKMELSQPEAVKNNASSQGESACVPESIAGAEPKSAFWMVRPASVPRNNPQTGHPYLHAVTETLVSTARPDPAFAVRMHPGQSFACNQAQDSQPDSTSLFIQLPPRSGRPDETEKSFNPPATQKEQGCSAPPTSTRLFTLPTSSVGFRNADSGLSKAGPKDEPTDISSTDLENQKNEIAAYRRVTELNPMNDRAWDALGNIYESNGMHDEAITAFERAIAIDGQREAYHYHLGIALAYRNQYEKAIQVLQRVVEMNPQYMLAHCALAGYYRRLGRENEALEHIRIARPSIESENEYNQACFESISGDADRAIALLEIALEKQQVQPAMVRSDPDLDFIRRDPRFEALLYKNRIIN